MGRRCLPGAENNYSPSSSPIIPAPARRDPPAFPPLSGGFGPGAAPAGRQTLRQQFGERPDKFWVEERFNADNTLVAYIDKHVTGIREPAAYATVTWPVKRLRRRVDGGALLHPAPAPVIDPQLINLVGQRGLVTPDQRATGFGCEFGKRTAQLKKRRAIAGRCRLHWAFVTENAAQEILGTLFHIHSQWNHTAPLDALTPATVTARYLSASENGDAHFRTILTESR